MFACIGTESDSEEFLAKQTGPYDNIFDEDEDDGMENDEEYPTVRVTVVKKKSLRSMWRNALIIKLVGHSVGYNHDGMANCGCVLRDENGIWLVGFSFRLGFVLHLVRKLGVPFMGWNWL